MADRREFITRALIASGVAGFTARTGALAAMLRSIEKGADTVPEGWEFYEVNDQILFGMYGEGGSPLARYAVYLWQPPSVPRTHENTRTAPFISIGFTPDELNMPPESLVFKVKLAIASQKPALVNLDGGALPLPEGWKV